MRNSFDMRWLNAVSRHMRRWVAPALVLTCAVPTAGLLAKDRPGKGKSEAVAKKIDEGTRLGTGDTADKHVLSKALEAARSSRESVQKVKGYSATFIKQEQLKKGTIRQAMQLKLRREPFSVYVKFIDPHEGREVIFVEGQNKGKLLVHEPSGLASLAGTISLSPTGDEAMKENRYPISMIGMEKLLDTLIVQWEGELKHPESDVKLYPQAKVGSVECKMFEVTHDTQRPHFKFHKTRLYIDKNSNLPIRLEQYGFPGKSGDEAPLVEEYVYTEIKADISLADKDFDVKNESYGFK